MERVVLSGPLSSEASFRLVVDGDWTTKECNRVLSILNVVVGHLLEDQAEAQRQAAIDRRIAEMPSLAPAEA